MYNLNDVQVTLRSLPIADNRSDSLIEYCCERAVEWVVSRLKEGVKTSSPLVLSTIVAMAEFFLSMDGVSESDGYDTYSVGDLTLRRNCEKELKVAIEKRDQALSYAAGILRDGDFYFTGI